MSEALCECGHPYHNSNCPKCTCIKFFPKDGYPISYTPGGPLIWIVGFLGLILLAHRIGPWAVTTVKYGFVALVAYRLIMGLRFFIRHPLLSVAWVLVVGLVLSGGVWMLRAGWPMLPEVKLILAPIDALLRVRDQRTKSRAARVSVLSKSINATPDQQARFDRVLYDCDSQLETAMSLNQKKKVEELQHCSIDGVRALLTPAQVPLFEKFMAQPILIQRAQAPTAKE